MYLIRTEEELTQLNEILEAILNKDVEALQHAERPDLIIYLFRRLGGSCLKIKKESLIRRFQIDPNAPIHDFLVPALFVLEENHERQLDQRLKNLTVEGLTEQAIQSLLTFILCFYELDWVTYRKECYLQLTLDEANHACCEVSYIDLLHDYQPLMEK